MLQPTSYNLQLKSGFTLIEIIIYLGLVSIILTAVSYLILDIIGGQVNTQTDLEVNNNVRFLRDNISRDVRSAQAISVPSADILILTLPGEDVTYFIDAVYQKVTRQLGTADPIDITSDEVEISGSFTDVSYVGRTATVQADLTVTYSNPSNLVDYDAERQLIFSVEARGRR